MNARRFALPLIILALVIGGLLLWQRNSEQRRNEEQLAEAQGIVRVLSATFTGKAALKVGEVRGTLDVTSVDPGAVDLLRSAQKAVLPYSVDYSLDLTQLDAEDYRWEPESRTLTIRLPAVRPDAPNVDEGARRVLATQGVFVTRDASVNLQRRASQLATREAARVAAEPANLARAQASAATVVAKMASAPLEAAGLGPVRVVTVSPTEDAGKSRENWDVSRSIAEVLAEQRR